MKKDFPGSTGPGNYIVLKCCSEWLDSRPFFNISVLNIWGPGTLPVLRIIKYFLHNYTEASITWQGESFVWLFPSTCVTTSSDAHSFGLCISEGVFIIQRLPYFYCILIHICLLTDSCSWNNFLHTLYLITLNLILHWPLCKVRSTLLSKRERIAILIYWTFV